MYRFPGLASGRQTAAETTGALFRPCLSRQKEQQRELMRFMLLSNPCRSCQLRTLRLGESGRPWPTLDCTSKLVLLLYGCFDSLTCTSIPGSSMNWQAARAMVPSMFSRQPWSTFCSIWWDTGRKHGKMVTKLCSSARRLCPGLLSSAMWVPWFYTEGSRRDASSPVKVC